MLERHRHDAILYEHDSGRQVAISDTIYTYFSFNSSEQHTFSLLRELDETIADRGRFSVVHQYINTCYSYTTSTDGYIYVLFTQSASILKPIALVFDPYWLKLDHGLQSRFDEILVDIHCIPLLDSLRLHVLMCIAMYSSPQCNESTFLTLLLL